MSKLTGPLALLTAVLIAGCGYSVEQLTEDHELRRQVLKDCAAMGLAAKDEDKCSIAAQAEVEAAKRGAGNLLNSLSK